MSSDAVNEGVASSSPSSIADVLRGVEPMGDLSGFVVEDLTVEEEDEFFGILESF